VHGAPSARPEPAAVALAPASGNRRTASEQASRAGLDALETEPKTDQTSPERGSEHTGRSLEVPAKRMELIADGGLAADLVVQHSSLTSDSLFLEHLDVEKLSVHSLDVKRFDLE